MKKNIITYFFLCLSFSINFIICSDENKKYSKALPFMNDELLYPSSPLQRMRSNSMQLWGVLHAASLSSEFQLELHYKLDDLIEKILTIYGDFYSFYKDFQNNIILYDRQEIQSLYGLLCNLEKLFEYIMKGDTSAEVVSFIIISKNIQKKLEQMLAL